MTFSVFEFGIEFGSLGNNKPVTWSPNYISFEDWIFLDLSANIEKMVFTRVSDSSFPI
jgi:hypothetical protein